jgi:hypothetical protein
MFPLWAGCRKGTIIHRTAGDRPGSDDLNKNRSCLKNSWALSSSLFLLLHLLHPWRLAPDSQSNGKARAIGGIVPKLLYPRRLMLLLENVNPLQFFEPALFRGVA